MGLSLDLKGLFEYLGITPDKITPLLILGWLGYWLFSRKINESAKILKKSILELQHCVIEIQTSLKTKLQETFEYKINPFAEPGSPLRLKDDYRHFVEKSDIAKQVKEKEKELTKWLRDKKPETGLDAQKEINGLVTSTEIEKFIDLKNYKQYVYEHGKDSGAAMAILAVYLYETIIPKAIKEKKKS